MTNFKWIVMIGLLIICGSAAAETITLNIDDLARELINPNTAYLLLIVGIYGLLTELAHPGLVLPGLCGVVALSLAGYGMSHLPVNYIGLGLLIFGIICMLSEVHITSYGILGISGFMSFIAGSIFLYQGNDPNMQVSKLVILVMTLLTVGFFSLIFWVVMRAHKRPIVTGQEALLHSTGTVSNITKDTIFVLITGEIWQAQSNKVLTKGQHVKVVKADGLYLQVEPTDKEK